jgi:hypothetical protein
VAKIGQMPNSLSYRFLINWVCVTKENDMSIALAVILLIRIILPLALLLAIGEWAHRREANYWLRR